LIAAGIDSGDEVITVPNTFIATTEAISQAGAKPVFVDIDERTYNMDPNQLEDYLKFRNSQSTIHNGQPKAVLPVHLYGQPADVDSILEIANRYGLIVIEDACQAHGALYYSEKEVNWRKCGSMGVAGCFSFYPGKNLGACGEGGAVTTNNEGIAQEIRMLRDHGQAKKYYHEFEGYNGRLDTIQTGILRVKLKHLSEWNEMRRQRAYLYNELLTGADGIAIPYEPSWTKAVYHLYIIRIKKRDELQKYLTDKGIGTGLHYPIPLHLQKAYSGLGYVEGDFPIAEKVASDILSLPMFPGLTAQQQTYITTKIKEFYSSQPK
jgi:dTDP-4-amino-4,6-dideoxygalactose transaminase